MSFSTLGREFTSYVKPKRAIDSVYIHCDASSNPNLSVRDIHKMHIDRGWSGCGYHIYIDDAGRAWHGRDLESTGAHTSGYNEGSLGICLNGLKLSDFSEAQFDKLRSICSQINQTHSGKIRFREHNDVAAKACPVFDAYKVLNLNRKGYMQGISSEEGVVSHIPMVQIELRMAQVGLGDKHEHVKWVQEILGLKPVDGIFGPGTDKAVKAFQDKHGLKPDGIVGLVTWGLLLDVGA
jgi:peptidoglycan hydrolase-like protein with peptidoglycan-binding domain